ncbi:MAG: hypothetical protein KDN05_03405 [Verrucomicrobiae bacterium]|nr:hypothetical protein [Verrucomicrobiae bacterium]
MSPGDLVALSRADQPRLEDRVLLFADGDPVAKALGVTEDERAELEREWGIVKDAVHGLQKKALHYQQRDDELWIGAEPFDGRELQSRFRESVLARLGPERGEAFLAMTKAEDAFGGWGSRSSAAYSIKYERQPDSTLLFRISEKPSPDGPAGRSWISNRIPEHIREITDELGISSEAPGS